MTFIPQTEQVSTIDSDWPEAWHSTGLNSTGSGSGSGFSNLQSRTNGGSASLGSFGNNQDPFQSHLLSVGNSAEQSRPHQHCTTGKSFSEGQKQKTICVHKMFSTCSQHVLNMFSTCSELAIFMYWSRNSMNNLLSYCGLVDARISASDKDLPLQIITVAMNQQA